MCGEQEVARKVLLAQGTAATLEATPGQFDCFSGQLQYKYQQNRVAYVGD
jgi:hypothetical protein